MNKLVKNMLYNINYNDKVLLGPLPKEAAELKLSALNKCFINLKLIPLPEDNEEPAPSE